MRVLVVGGSGRVGRMTLPHLAAEHELTVFDQHPPRADVPGVGYLPGDVADFAALRDAVAGQDAVLFMAMGPAEGSSDWGSARNGAAQLDVAVKGLYLTLRAARDEGIRQAVFTSSMSVYRMGNNGFPEPLPSEEVPPDAHDHYGLAKRLGEEVARAVCQETEDANVVALRLCLPVPDEEWPPDPARVTKPVIATSARDVAAALLTALRYDSGGFEAFAISGDDAGQLVNVARAAAVLDWRPRDGTSGLARV